jgi:twitching motility protein PilT
MMRVQGKMQPIPGLPAITDSKQLQELIFSLVREDQRKEAEKYREYDFAWHQKGLGRFRCNIGYERGNLFLTARRLYDRIPTPEELGLPEALVRMTQLEHGLVLVTGPTGSGKSTTLASLLQLINSRDPLNIVTVEDPIEYVHEDDKCTIHQREVGADTRNFGEAIRRAMRQDPDILVVGEVRDPETISAALTAAETGHLVFATLHTKNVPLTIDRLIDMFPPEQQAQVRAQLANALECIVSQRLVPTADGEGRVAAFEVMVMTSGIRNLIRENKVEHISSSIQTGGQSHGMITMDQSLGFLAGTGKVKDDDARRFVKSVKDYDAARQQAGRAHFADNRD